MNDVLAIATAALVVDTVTAGFLMVSGAGGEMVREWYRTLRIGAYAMDVLSLTIGAYIAMRAAPDSLLAQLALVVAIQTTHDVAFGFLIRTTPGPLMALFRRYADEMGVRILWADAMMMVATVGLAHWLQKSQLGSNDIALTGTLAAYVGLLIVYSF